MTIHGTLRRRQFKLNQFSNVTVYAGGGNDTIHAGYVGNGGINYIYGRDGNDRVFTNSARQVWVSGGAGNDTVQGSSGYDAFYGGSGTDTYIGAQPGRLLRRGREVSPEPRHRPPTGASTPRSWVADAPVARVGDVGPTGANGSTGMTAASGSGSIGGVDDEPYRSAWADARELELHRGRALQVEVDRADAVLAVDRRLVAVGVDVHGRRHLECHFVDRRHLDVEHEVAAVDRAVRRPQLGGRGTDGIGSVARPRRGEMSSPSTRNPTS